LLEERHAEGVVEGTRVQGGLVGIAKAVLLLLWGRGEERDQWVWEQVLLLDWGEAAAPVQVAGVQVAGVGLLPWVHSSSALLGVWWVQLELQRSVG